jgi:hypothetical protein
MKTTIKAIRESIRLTLQEIDSKVNNELELKFADVVSPDEVFGPVPPKKSQLDAVVPDPYTTMY